MTVQHYYAYLVAARRDLWAFLETVPAEARSKPVLPGKRFHCINDLILHVPVVEDSWIHEDILRDQPVWESIPELENAQDGPYYADMPLEVMLRYWRAVEVSTLAYLETVNATELERPVEVNGSKGLEHFSVSGLLWHVMQHETRHTAQIALLTRQLGFSPPQLDLIAYLPTTRP